MVTFFESEKDKAVKGEGWAPHFNSCAQDTVGLYNPHSPCYFSPLSEIPGSTELLENSLTYEGVQWRKITECTAPMAILL